IEALKEDPLKKLEFPEDLDKLERYVLLRALETGLVSKTGFSKMVEMRARYKTIGSALIYGGICQWESLLGYCLDTRPPSRLDPPSLRTLIERREWELTGEILVSLGKINRTQLEYSLKIKRDGNQALGQILTAMGACKQEDVDRCLKIQQEVKMPPGGEVALIGKLLVNQGILSEEDLEDALRNQRIARQPLAKILVSMGACAQRDIDSFAKVSGISFQSEIDDVSLGNYLLKTDSITKIHLEEALRIQQRGRQVLGEMLVSMGLCSAQDIENVIQFQREVRETHRSGVEKLGSILIHAGKVPPPKVEEAVKLQTMGRQPFGAILVAMGYCSADDVMIALEIQQKWRGRDRAPGDRLGEILVKQGLISEEELEDPLLEHMREEKPLGRILIDRNLCSPEQIIDALIDRDHKRQYEFLEFVRSCTGQGEGAEPPGKSQPETEKSEGKKSSIVDRLSTWFSRPKSKP
ncbi:MAG: hypothetical protein K2X27_08430, partial [Candidatus Obscuribacterales bacterium]|nr:hypothetical protein [Candidatus Obscuribacterales bacterium]